jgi:hypothetical protein
VTSLVLNKEARYTCQPDALTGHAAALLLVLRMPAEFSIR